MHYPAFSITLPARFHDSLVAALMNKGSLGVVENNRTLTFYFPCQADLKDVAREIEVFRRLLLAADPSVQMSVDRFDVPDTDWNEAWKRNFTPLDIGERFTVLPPWETAPAGRKAIIIDPGRAFGTGHHGTTRSCLMLMEKHAPPGQGGRFLDVGTGTGLLAIAALFLGFGHVEGIDTDPLAIEAANRNIDLNGVGGRIRLRKGDLRIMKGAFDMIAANLISGTLVRIAPLLAERLSEGGKLICSGILAGQEQEVLDAMGKTGLCCREKVLDGKWVTLACERRP